MNEPTAYFAVISEWHVILLVFVILLLFGGKKLPELARGLGEAMKEFKRASREDHDNQGPSTTGGKQPPADSKQLPESQNGKPPPRDSSGGPAA